jgi:hypothetical protein
MGTSGVAHARNCFDHETCALVGPAETSFACSLSCA